MGGPVDPILAFAGVMLLLAAALTFCILDGSFDQGAE